jgi:hypothetical protein
VVRAYFGDGDGARQLISELGTFAMDEDGAAELEDQRLLIEEILAGTKSWSKSS